MDHAIEVEIARKKYFRKLHVHPAVETWNKLYRRLLPELYLAFHDKVYDYFPTVGTEVKRSNDPHRICRIAQDKLNSLGYESIELTPEQCNITNVREHKDDYFPIDMLKIRPLRSDMAEFLDGLFGGKRRTKKLKRSKRTKRKRK
jgi:hypothetical protein